MEHVSNRVSHMESYSDSAISFYDSAGHVRFFVDAEFKWLYDMVRNLNVLFASEHEKVFVNTQISFEFEYEIAKGKKTVYDFSAAGIGFPDDVWKEISRFNSLKEVRKNNGVTFDVRLQGFFDQEDQSYRRSIPYELIVSTIIAVEDGRLLGLDTARRASLYRLLEDLYRKEFEKLPAWSACEIEFIARDDFYGP